jgi:hypothetical protein
MEKSFICAVVTPSWNNKLGDPEGTVLNFCTIPMEEYGRRSPQGDYWKSNIFESLCFLTCKEKFRRSC